MKIAGHLAGGWLVSRWLINKSELPITEKRQLLALGTLAGVLPDLDYLWYAYKKGRFEYKNDFRHHTWISHTFPFYWIPAAVLYGIGVLRRKSKLKLYASFLAAGTTVHLLQDTIGSGDGIMLLYPISKRMYGIGLSGLHGDEWNAKYVESPVYKIELSVCLLAAVTFLYELFKKRL
jgi:hypothetical protein